MRSAIVAAAFAAGALAVPYKRDVVTDVDVVTATVYQTVWADEAPATSAPAVVVTTTATTKAAHYGHHHKSSSTPEPSPSPYSVEVSTQAPAPAPSTQAASSAPAPAPSSSEAPSSSAAPAVSSYQAPASSYEAPSSSAAAPSTYASSASGPASTGYSDIVLYHHNIHRANHSASDVTWDDELAGWAQQIADKCVYAHDRTVGDGNYGQNIAAGVPQNNVSAVITDLFYNGEVGWYDNLYNQDQPNMDNFEKWGHFSQIVWSDTTHVGCATKNCGDGGLANVGSTVPPHFTVCNYKSAGNVPNAYKNVGDSLGHPTVQWNAGL